MSTGDDVAARRLGEIGSVVDPVRYARMRMEAVTGRYAEACRVALADMDPDDRECREYARHIIRTWKL